MFFMLKQVTFEYFLKPLIGICGIMAIYGYFTGQAIEPMISSAMAYAFQIAVAIYHGASEAIPIIMERVSEFELPKEIPDKLSKLESS